MSLSAGEAGCLLGNGAREPISGVDNEVLPSYQHGRRDITPIIPRMCSTLWDLYAG